MPNQKPLASITFGKALQNIRRQLPGLKSSTDTASGILMIGGSTLRMLEAGLLLPPYSLAGPLAMHYGLSFSSVSVVLGLIHSVDHHPYLQIKDEAEWYARAVPRLRFFAKQLMKAASLAQATAHENGAELMRSPELVEELASFLLQPYNDEAAMTISRETLRNLSLDNSTIAFLRQILAHKKTVA